MKQKMRYRLMALLCLLMSTAACAQNLLSKIISIEASRQRLDQVLEMISNKGAFYFSYNSNSIKGDSLVFISAQSKPVQQILTTLLPGNYEFKESGNYIIIKRIPIRITIITTKAVTENKFYVVSGYVLDNGTGHVLPDASIYEKQLLAATLTNNNGYFKLKLKNKAGKAALTVSKQFYQDTTVSIDPAYNQQITITIIPYHSADVVTISPDDYFAPDELKLSVERGEKVTEYIYVKTDSAVSKVDRTTFVKALFSTRQHLQNLNLSRFFVSRPYQVSLTPGLGTHGRLSPQVSNHFSFNVLGGYNGGVNGFELGGLFNIDKQAVKYAQIGGLFNIVGGRVDGLQIGGLSNTVLDAVQGLQIGGINNIVKGSFTGFQIGGVYNHVTDSTKGFQLGGIANYSRARVNGLQISGITNIAGGEVRGAQIGGIVNYAKKLKGLQIGLINIADTSDGYSIGLINVVLKGYHKLAFSTNELLNANVAFKTGSRHLYSILQGGLNISNDQKLCSFGYGIGHEGRLGRTFSLNPELTSQYLYRGSWHYINVLSKAALNLNIRLGKYAALFGGPVYNVYYSDQTAAVIGKYGLAVPPEGYHTHDLGNRVTGWVGWQAGISFF